jgi:RNA polymerase sigma factor (sigma-70 family)
MHASHPYRPYVASPAQGLANALVFARAAFDNQEFAKFAPVSEGSKGQFLEGRMMQGSQAELIDLLLQRDKKAFEKLYDDYSAAIYGLVLKILRDEAMAEDALQDAFVRIWQKIHTYDESKGRLFTWMLNVARNIAIDKVRANTSRGSERTSTLQLAHADSRGPSTTMQVEHIGLREMVDALPQDQKFVIELIYFLGYTQAEVAEEFGIPLGTVKSRVRLAMNQLRAKIE